MLLGAAEDAVRAPDLVSTKAKMTELRLAGFTAVRVTSNWRPGLTAPTSGELGILRNIEAAARLSGVKVLVSVYSPGSATTPLRSFAVDVRAETAAQPGLFGPLKGRYLLKVTTPGPLARTAAPGTAPVLDPRNLRDITLSVGYRLGTVPTTP